MGPTETPQEFAVAPSAKVAAAGRYAAADLTVEAGVDSYTELGTTATDDVDGRVAVSVSGRVDATVLGDYVVTYSATDAAGNTATATRPTTPWPWWPTGSRLPTCVTRPPS